jgi:hypothetical protein
VELRERGFLLWLDQFVGDWNLDGQVQVARRDDGFLEVRYADKHRKVPLASVFKRGKFVTPAEGPLGPRPVVLSGQLMNLWLTPEQMKSLEGAWHVPAGISRILETIEKRIKEMPKADREKRFNAFWWHHAKSIAPLRGSDLTTHLMLLGRYKAENRKKP